MSTGTVLALASAAAGGAMIYYSRLSRAHDLAFDGVQGLQVTEGPGTDPGEEPATDQGHGWIGDPEEFPAKRIPIFPNTIPGHVAFTKWSIDSLQKLGLTHESSVLFTAHLARETGYGRSIYNYNIGNIKTGSSNPKHPWFWLTDNIGKRDRYRWYANALDGLSDDLRLIREGAGGRYVEAWQMLLNSDPAWYVRLGQLGYYEGAQNQSDYDSIVDNIRRYEPMETDVAVPVAAQSGIESLATFAVSPIPALQRINVSASGMEVAGAVLLSFGLGYLVIRAARGV